MLARPPRANYARARLARLGIHPAHPRPQPAGLPAVISRGIAHNCQQLKSTCFSCDFSLASQLSLRSHASGERSHTTLVTIPDEPCAGRDP